MSSYKDLAAKADAAQAKADDLRGKASEQRLVEGRARPLKERLTFAAYVRCDCGAGMAYDPFGEPDPPLKMVSKWQCSDIILCSTYDEAGQVGVKKAVHTPPLPFAFYEIKSENQPSANGATTRERVADNG